MNNIKTFIIIDPNSKKGDKKLYNLLRSTDVSFTTGYCEDFDSPCNKKGCIWYLTNREISFGDLYLSKILGCKYKMITTDECSFECNCDDIDLPMIEDIWNIINNEKSVFYWKR
jgi:hypothetical protein